MGEVAQKDFTYRMTEDEYFRYNKNRWIYLSKSGKIGPMRDRSDFNDALSTLNRLHQETGEQQLRPVSFWKYQNGTHHLVIPQVGAMERVLVELMTLKMKVHQ